MATQSVYVTSCVYKKLRKESKATILQSSLLSPFVKSLKFIKAGDSVHVYEHVEGVVTGRYIPRYVNQLVGSKVTLGISRG